MANRVAAQHLIAASRSPISFTTAGVGASEETAAIVGVGHLVTTRTLTVGDLALASLASNLAVAA